LFIFRSAVADEMRTTLGYLYSQLQPNDGLLGLPYVHRYEFLTDRPTPADLGTELWDETARRADRERLVTQLAQNKPRFIVFNQTEWPDSDGIPWMDRLPEVADFVFSHYHIARIIGRTIIYEIGPPLAGPPRVVDPGDLQYAPYLTRGWFEPSSDGKMMVRWSSTSATAFVYRPAGAGRFFLELDVAPPPVPQTLTVTLDGKLAVRRPLTGDFGSITVPVPVGVPKSGSIRVDFDISPAVAAPDTRFLGVAVKRFGFSS